MTELEEYLRGISELKRSSGFKPPVGVVYLGTEDYVLERGSEFTSRPLTPLERKAVLQAVDLAGGTRRVSVRKSCFANAQQVVLADESGLLSYAEGYAIGRAHIPMLHGWISVGGAIVDLTWKSTAPRKSGRLKTAVLGVIPDGWMYRGVVFSGPTVLMGVLRSGMYQSLIDDWQGGWPLLRGEQSCLPA